MGLAVLALGEIDYASIERRGARSLPWMAAECTPECAPLERLAVHGADNKARICCFILAALAPLSPCIFDNM